MEGAAQSHAGLGCLHSQNTFLRKSLTEKQRLFPGPEDSTLLFSIFLSILQEVNTGFTNVSNSFGQWEVVGVLLKNRNGTFARENQISLQAGVHCHPKPNICYLTSESCSSKLTNIQHEIERFKIFRKNNLESCVFCLTSLQEQLSLFMKLIKA